MPTGARRWLVAVLLTYAVVLASAPGADGRARRAVKTTDVCYDVNRPIPDEGRVGDFIELKSPTLPLANGSTVLDTDARVRIVHPAVGQLDVALVGPIGVMMPLSFGNGGDGDDFGSGPTDCGASFAVFDDEAATPIQAITPAAAPFAGSFRPEGALSVMDTNWADGLWRFYVDDTMAGNQGTVEAIGLQITYRCIVGRKRCGKHHPRRRHR